MLFPHNLLLLLLLYVECLLDLNKKEQDISMFSLDLQWQRSIVLAGEERDEDRGRIVEAVENVESRILTQMTTTMSSAPTWCLIENLHPSITTSKTKQASQKCLRRVSRCKCLHRRY